MKWFKWIVIISISLILILAIFLFVRISPLFGGMDAMTENKAEEFLICNGEQLSYIIKCMSLMDYKEIEMRKTNENCVTYLLSECNGTENEQYMTSDISNMFDYTALKYIKELYTNGVRVIYKYNNIYKFSLWSSLNAGKGLLYSENEDHAYMPGIINTQNIAPKWYYYYECMDMWQERQ